MLPHIVVIAFSLSYVFSTLCEIIAGFRVPTQEILLQQRLRVIFVALCGPKYTQLGHNASETLQFVTSFFIYEFCYSLKILAIKHELSS